MPTLNKAESSRINGAKSHGPVTPEGKQHSSLNSLRHGILAQFICLTSEDKDKFKELVRGGLGGDNAFETEGTSGQTVRRFEIRRCRLVVCA